MTEKNNTSYIAIPEMSDVFDDNSSYNTNEYELLLEAVNNINVPNPGKVVKGEFIGQDEHHFLLDCGFKDLVRVQNSSGERPFFALAKIGDMIDVIVLQISDKSEYSIDGSVSIIYREYANEILREMEDDQYVDVRVDRLNAAGYDCTIILNGCEISAFLPQVLAGVNKIHDDAKSDLVGKRLEMCIESFADDKGTWIVSRRKYLKQLIPGYIRELDNDVLYTGHVTGTTKFGVFVEFFECLTGMIHKSNLVPELQENFHNIKDGDEIQFKVKEVIKKNKIILTQVDSVSLWDTIEEGQVLTGIVKDHKPFGTLVKLDHETSGLIHTTKQTNDVLQLDRGDKVDVRIITIEKSKRKIYLTSV